MTAQPKVIRLPVDAKSRRQRQLRAAWAEEDRLEQQLRAARGKARALEREVGRDRGYFLPIGREKLELALQAKKGQAE